MTPNHLELARGVGSLFLAGGLWAGQQLAQVVAPIDPTGWGTSIEKFGLPIAMCIALAVGLVKIFGALRAESAARIADKEASIQQYRADSAAAENSRTKLLEATAEQTREFRSLREELARARRNPNS